MLHWKNQLMETFKRRSLSYWVLLILNSVAILVGLPVVALTSRIYFQNGGKSKWILSWANVAGWPITASMLLPMYLFFKIHPTRLTLKLTLSYVVLGFLSVAHNMMFAYASANLPASTGTLLASTILVFTCLFGYLILNNKPNASIINSIVIITAAITIVALDSNSNKYHNVSNHQYICGFIWDVLASVLQSLNYSLFELHFNTLLGRRSFHVVLEQRTMISFFAFVFTSIVVIIHNDFEGMKSEAKTFVGGEGSYVKVLIWNAIAYQLVALGTSGVVFLTSSLTAVVQTAVAIPLTSIVVVVVLNDPMSGFKIMSFLLTLWGFACYIYASSSSLNTL